MKSFLLDIFLLPGRNGEVRKGKQRVGIDAIPCVCLRNVRSLVQTPFPGSSSSRGENLKAYEENEILALRRKKSQELRCYEAQH